MRKGHKAERQQHHVWYDGHTMTHLAVAFVEIGSLVLLVFPLPGHLRPLQIICTGKTTHNEQISCQHHSLLKQFPTQPAHLIIASLSSHQNTSVD
jgi:hypothetical protein